VHKCIKHIWDILRNSNGRRAISKKPLTPLLLPGAREQWHGSSCRKRTLMSRQVVLPSGRSAIVMKSRCLSRHKKPLPTSSRRAGADLVPALCPSYSTIREKGSFEMHPQEERRRVDHGSPLSCIVLQSH
jgi:hypothetical protein